MNNRYQYNGKERVEDLGIDLYEYGFRFSDQTIGRFISVDPLSSKFPWWTTYQYAGNMPVNFVDLDGLEPAKNPKSPETSEIYGMNINSAIAGGAKLNNKLINGDTSNNSLLGTNSSGINQYKTDTTPKDADLFNLYTNTSIMFNVDESNAYTDIKNYETFVVSTLLLHFVSGTGPENYNFPTNGVISSKFLDSDILKHALIDFEGGKLVNKKYDFGFSDLAKDTFRNGNIFNITGLVGSATITMSETSTGVSVQIFNITSLTSGSFGKEVTKPIYGNEKYPHSYVRGDQTTPYGNISQTYNLLIPYSSIQSVIDNGRLNK